MYIFLYTCNHVCLCVELQQADCCDRLVLHKSDDIVALRHTALVYMILMSTHIIYYISRSATIYSRCILVYTNIYLNQGVSFQRLSQPYFSLFSRVVI
jgi:hypothetical protein